MKFSKREIVQSEGSGLFLKLGDGESVTGVFRGDVYEFYSKWVGNRSQLTTPEDPEGKSRFRLNFVTKEGDRWTAKIWEFGTIVYNQLAELNDEYTLDETKVKVTRRGTGTDTTYSILPLLKEKFDLKTVEAIESVNLHALEHRDAAVAI
jgi:hypothetical protein